jgi:uroporphyrinogen decarboxylase
MQESRGPVLLNPIRSTADLNRLRIVDPEKHLRFVLDAISMTQRGLHGRVPLIGFAGSPWTLASYMIEGSGKRDFATVKRFMLDSPDLLRQLLVKLTEGVQRFLEAQIAAGVNALQIFDSWGGILDPDHYRMFSLDPMFEIFSRLRRDGTPLIVYSRGASHAFRDLTQIGADVVGIDWTLDMAVAKETAGGRVALQGNLDPSFLYASPESIRKEVRSILRKFGRGPGHVFNLGHGIPPDVPVEHALAFVHSVQEESRAFHL